LLRLAAASPVDVSGEFAKLHAWALRAPEGFAKCIETAGRRHREKQRKKAAAAFFPSRESTEQEANPEESI
jgi:hypothetical protein